MFESDINLINASENANFLQLFFLAETPEFELGQGIWWIE